jgi:hypothetical protein
MATFYNDDGDIDGAVYDYDRAEEAIMQRGSELFKELMEVSMIENYIDDEMYKKRVWLLRKLSTTITHEDIDFYMNKATDEEINQEVIKRTMELANA